MWRLYVEAMRDSWRRPRRWIEGLGLLLLWCALAWWWLSLPVASAADLVLLVLLGLAVIAIPLWLSWRARGIWRSRQAGMAFLLALAAALVLPWLLVNWVPAFESFAMQAASMALRFVLAAVCFVGAWLWAAGVAARLTAERSETGVEDGTDPCVE